jgi:hypothetical protein
MPLAILDVSSIVSATGWTGATVANLSTSNDVRATGGTAAELIEAELSNTPSDFWVVSSGGNTVIAWVEARTVGTVTRAKSILLEILDSSGVVQASGSTSTLNAFDADHTVLIATLGGFTKSQVDGWRLRATVQEAGGMADSATVEIDRLWVEITYDVVPPSPVLSSPTVDSITTDGGQPKVTSDIDAGSVSYVLVADGATPPNEGQIIGGVDGDGGTPIKTQIKTCVAGVNTFNAVTGLASGTPYDVYFVASNGSGVFSNIVKADFTTTAGAVQIEMDGDAAGAGSAAGTIALRIGLVGQSSSSGSAQAAIATLTAIAGAASAAGSATGTLRGITAIIGQVSAAGALTGIIVRVQPIQGQAMGSGLTAATLRAIVSLIGSVTGVATAVAAFEEEGGFITGAVIGVGSAAAELTLWQSLEGDAAGAGLTEADVETIISLTGAGSGFGLALADLSAILTMLGHAMASGTPAGDLDAITSFVIEIPPCPSIVEVEPSQNVVLLEPSVNVCEIVQSTTTIDLICLTSEEEEALANG